ncbi:MULTISPECIES: DinB family protein [Streptacidiphilus]|uniref:DinB family protein n=1 Tax=Streptacidiphilus cavernicola TaxID=3342716 RepID=A0ABV6UU63_9ACTN|nr:DinB family protein [Streptacidiphilus jeojiense]
MSVHQEQSTTPPGPVTRDLLETLDEVRDRTLARLEGLTDAEYLWEPVASCMTLRPAADGSFRADPRPGAEDGDGDKAGPAPFTTIGWRVWHIGADCLRSYGRFFGDEPLGDDRHLWPGTAAEGVALMSRDWARFRGQVEALGDQGLLQPMGPRAGAYSHESYLLLALHALDEVAHHGAELGVLRDLYLHGFKARSAEPA